MLETLDLAFALGRDGLRVVRFRSFFLGGGGELRVVQYQCVRV